MTSYSEDEIPLAKRQKHLQQERGVHTKLPPAGPQEEKTVSPDSDYIVIDSSEDEDVIVGRPAAATATATSPLPRAQWLPIPLRPINYRRKSASLEKQAPPPAVTVKAEEKNEMEDDDEEEEIIELSSTTEEGVDNNNDISYEKQRETARRVEQDVILLGHGSSDDEKMRKQARKRPRAQPPPQTTRTLPSASRQGRPPPTTTAPSGSRLNPSHRPYSNGNGNATQGPGRPFKSTDILDTPYEFKSREVASEFKNKFTSTGSSKSGSLRPASRVYPVINHSAVDKRAKEILHEMAQTKQQAVQKSQVAWTAAALKWREKNKPSEAELKRRAQEDSARVSEAARRRAKLTPMAHSARAAESEGNGNNRNARRGGGNGTNGGDINDPPPPRPAANAPELERRSYYRTIAQRKVTHASSFAQVLTLLGVPCDDPSQIKYSYRIAVRMFHPDSNSKEKVWNTLEEKVQAEEVMKIINERKERDF